MEFLIYLAAFVVSIIVIVAQFQLFAIRNLLTELVRLNGGHVSVPAPFVTDYTPARTGQMMSEAETIAHLKGLDEQKLMATWEANPKNKLVEREVRTRGFYVG